MEKLEVQKYIIRKLMNFNPPKWGGSHTEERNLFKGLPAHLIGTKTVKKAFEGLVKSGMLLKAKKTGEWHYSLNPRMAKEIYEFVNLE